MPIGEMQAKYPNARHGGAPRLKKGKSLFAIAVAGAVLAACGSTTSKPPAASSKSGSPKAHSNITINLGTFPDPRPLGIVKEEGWLSQEGYHVNWDNFLNGVPGELAAMEGGSLDIAQLDTSGAMPLFEKDPTLAWYVANETSNVAQIVARKGSGIHSLSQLHGKTVATTGVTTAPQVIFDLALAHNHIPLNSNTYPQTTGPDEVIAMEKGAVQAATTYVPFSAQMILNGTGRLLTSANTVYGQPWVAGGLVVTRSFGKAHPHAVEAVLSAILKAEALMKSNPQLSDNLLAKYSGAPPASIAYSYNHDLVSLLPLVPNTTALIKEATTEATYNVFHGNPQAFVSSWVNPKFAQAVSK